MNPQVKQIMDVLKRQVPEDPFHQLFVSIIEQALKDLIMPRLSKYDWDIYQTSARAYLKYDLVHAEYAGLDKNWVRLVIKQAGIEL